MLPDLPDILPLAAPAAEEAVFDETGLRLSTDCVCARMRQSLDPTLYRDLDESIANRGHAFEDVFASTILHGEQFFRELVVPWGHGDAHMDFLVLSGRYGGSVVELKGNKDGALHPENVRQVQRYQYVVERALESERPIAAPLRLASPLMREANTRRVLYEKNGSPFVDVTDLVRSMVASWRVVVIDPSPRVWGVRQPDGHVVELPAEAVQREDLQHAQMDRIMADPVAAREALHYRDAWPECTCGKCWPAPEQDLPWQWLEAVGTYDHARDEEKLAKAEKDLASLRIRESMAALATKDGDGPWRYRGSGWKVSIGANDGTTYEDVDYKNGFVALGSEATLDDLRAAGYATTKTQRGQLRVTKDKEYKA